MATSQAEPPTARAPGVLAAMRTGVVAAAALVIGLFAGGLAVGLLAESAPVGATESGGGGGVPGGDLPDGGASAGFLVNGNCLGAVNAAQDAYLVMDDLGEAAAALDAAQLDEVVRRLQPLQSRLNDDLEACEVTAEVDGPTPGDTPDTESTDTEPTDTEPTDPEDAGSTELPTELPTEAPQTEESPGG